MGVGRVYQDAWSLARTILGVVKKVLELRTISDNLASWEEFNKTAGFIYSGAWGSKGLFRELGVLNDCRGNSGVHICVLKGKFGEL